MEEQLITFDTAKLSKEKGFENKTPHKLRRDYYNHLGEINGDVKEYVKSYINKKSTNNLETIDAPTQSLLQKWLREEHDLFVCVDKSDDKANSYFLSTNCIGIYGEYKTYEEALEKGLQEALKLIKI
jgi:hypothetical protein